MFITNEKPQLRYLYAMMPRTLNGEETNGWEGTISSLKRVISKTMMDAQTQLGIKIDKIQNETEIF